MSCAVPGPARVVAAPCASCQDPSALRSALEKVLTPQFAAYGSVSGQKLLLKPNLLAWRKAEDPACVHPAILLECAKVFLDAGAQVSVLENPAVQTADAVIRAMGLEDEFKRLNVPVASFSRFGPAENLPGQCFRRLEIAQEIREFNAVIDLAKAKTHGMMILTLCVKNLFGLVKGSDRLAWHLNVGRDFARFADVLLDIYLAVRPRFNLVDAVVCMEGNGPGSGDPARRGWIFGGTDALALDAWLAPLLTGKNAPEIPIVNNARVRGILPSFEVIGTAPDIKPLSLPPPPGLLCEWGVALPPGMKKLLRKYLVAHPALHKEKCVGCGLCARLCPAHCLRIVKGYPKFDYAQCIRCFCCLEHCPHGAVAMRRGVLMGVAEKLEKLVRQLASR